MTRPVALFLAASAVVSVGYGLRQSLGLLIAPMSAAHAWPVGVFAFAFALQNLAWGIAQPFAGAFVDRFGARAIVAAGGCMFVGAIAVLATAKDPLWFSWGGGTLLGVALAATWIGVLVGPISALVPPERRATAIGLLGAGGSVGQLLYPPLTQIALGSIGWFATLCVLGVLVAVVIPLAFFFPGERTVAAASTPLREPRGIALGAALREAFSVPSYGLLTAGFFVCGFHLAFFQTHLPAIVARAGLAPSVGAAGLAVVGAFNIAGTYCSGRLADRFPKRYVLASIYGLRALAMIVFLATPISALSVLVFSAVLGLLWLSTVSPTSAIIGEKFGLEWVSTLFGITFLSHQVGAFFGAWLGGVIVDRTGSYTLMWQVSIAVALFGVIIQLPIDERPVPRLALLTHREAQSA